MQSKVIMGVSLFVTALAIGLAAAFYTSRYIEQEKAAFQAEVQERYKLIPVVVPGRDLAAGERLLKRDMRIRQMPREFLTNNTIRPVDFDQFSGKTVRVPVDGGTPLVTSFIGEPGSSAAGSFSRSIPEDMRALTVGVSGTSAIAGLLVPGDRVDMMIQMRGPTGQLLLPLLGNVEILATGSTVSVEQGTPIDNRYRTITVVATPEDARRIVAAQQIGTLVVTLRNPGDNDPAPLQATTVEDIFDKRFAALVGAADGNGRAREVEIIQGVVVDGSGPDYGAAGMPQPGPGLMNGQAMPLGDPAGALPPSSWEVEQ